MLLKTIDNRNSRHIETIELWNWMKLWQMEGKSRVTINYSKSNKKNNESNEIYNSCSLQSKQIIVIKIILFIVLNADL